MYNSYNSHYYGSDNATGSVARGNIMGRMDETAAVALLQHLGKDDLQHLLTHDSKLNDLIQDLPQVCCHRRWCVSWLPLCFAFMWLLR